MQYKRHSIHNTVLTLYKFQGFHLLAVSGEGEEGCLIIVSISVHQGRAILHSSKEGSALIDINLVRHHRGDSLNLSTVHSHKGVSVIEKV